MAGLVPAIHVLICRTEIRGCPALRPGMTGIRKTRQLTSPPETFASGCAFLRQTNRRRWQWLISILPRPPAGRTCQSRPWRLAVPLTVDPRLCRCGHCRGQCLGLRCGRRSARPSRHLRVSAMGGVAGCGDRRLAVHLAMGAWRRGECKHPMEFADRRGVARDLGALVGAARASRARDDARLRPA